jgi:hypothetical protein
VSSDILSALALGIPPDKRGLVRQNNQLNWSFPENYIKRLKIAVDQNAFEENLLGTPGQ